MQLFPKRWKTARENQGYLEAIHWWQMGLWKGVWWLLWQICHQSCQQRRNSGPFYNTTWVLEDSVVPFGLYFGVLGLIWKITDFFQVFSQISRTPDFERSFRVKRCGLYAGVYGNSFGTSGMCNWFWENHLYVFLLSSRYVRMGAWTIFVGKFERIPKRVERW